ncbi:class I SAM-dependent methyltransferase [Dyella ginsengisoli]|uniref:class I SAM-dependent methyltransferase n=1 Tax=Dyella ginsengisoli TaxID=363848 RepID=UPI00034A5211|nr:class I SAM-dependent methyltransferase [Dyella ginsengisoli]
MRDAEEAILRVWHDSAAPWSRAVREGRIASRRRVTDAAVLAAIHARAPRSVIDLGCGEGWLSRALAGQGIDVLGVDMVPALVDAASTAGAGRYRVMDYAAVAAGGLGERADLVVCNFSLLGDASVDALLRGMPALLAPGGALVIQTLHPWSAGGEAPYRDGWREGSWAGCGEGFGAAAPWYFRTLAGWQRSFRLAGLALCEVAEPLDPETGRPASILFTLQVPG